MASLLPLGRPVSHAWALYWAFGECDFLQSLTAEARDDFGGLTSLFSYPPGSILLAEEELAPDVFILLRGEVKLSVASSAGKRFILRVARSGEILGLASSFSGNPCEVTAECLHSCDIAQLRRADFLGFLSRNPSVFQFVARELSLYYEQACVRLRTMGATSHVAAKLARLLLEWSCAERSDVLPRHLIRIPFTHAEIGECIGSTRETVTRLLTRLQKDGVIEIRGSILEITDRPALEGWPA